MSDTFTVNFADGTNLQVEAPEENIVTASERFIEKWNEALDAYYQKAYPDSLELPGIRSQVEVTWQGKRYARIVEVDVTQSGVRSGGGGCAGFIDKTNGDILFSAGWKAPAKHARGNVYAEDGGMSALQLGGRPHIRYLR